MSIDQPPRNKMMTEAPAKKGWHFPGDGTYKAEYIEAETIHDAEAIYHKIKKLFIGTIGDVPVYVDPAPTPQSTAPIDAEIKS